MLFEVDAKTKICKLLEDNGINFDNKQEEFIKQAQFRIIVQQMKSRGIKMY